MGQEQILWLVPVHQGTLFSHLYFFPGFNVLGLP